MLDPELPIGDAPIGSGFNPGVVPHSPRSARASKGAWPPSSRAHRTRRRSRVPAPPGQRRHRPRARRGRAAQRPARLQAAREDRGGPGGRDRRPQLRERHRRGRGPRSAGARVTPDSCSRSATAMVSVSIVAGGPRTRTGAGARRCAPVQPVRGSRFAIPAWARASRRAERGGAGLFPWPMIVAPIILGLAIFLITGHPFSLSIVAMSPLMLLGNFISQRTQIGRAPAQEVDTVRAQLEELEETLYRETPAERELRNAEAPAVAVVFERRCGSARCSGRDARSTGTSSPCGLGTTVRRSRDDRQASNAAEGHRASTSTGRWLRQPATETDRRGARSSRCSRRASASSASPGPRDAADALRGLGVQLFGLHSPNELVAVALTEPGVGEGARVAEMAAAHHERAQPVPRAALADSPSTGAALLSGLEELVLRSCRERRPRRGLPFDEDWDPMRYGTDVRRAAEEATFPGRARPRPRDHRRPKTPRWIAPGSRRCSSGARTSASTACSSLPTVDALPAVCRTFLDVTDGLGARPRGARCAAAWTTRSTTVEGVSNELMTMLAKRLAPVVDSSTVIEDSSDIPTP